MTKKRKRYPDLNQKLERPWCYYCERDFDDLKILISHQKAKHFKCERCNRRLNTAGGLSVHMNQVHKENLTHVENANPGRQGLDIEIFGMEGVPAEIVDQHNQQVTQAHFAEEQERARITGNPIRGLYSNGQAPMNKRARVTETLEDIEERAVKFRLDRKNGVLPLPVTDTSANSITQPVPASYSNPSTFPPGGPAPSFPPRSLPFSPTTTAVPSRPGVAPGQPAALPPRPGFNAPPPGAFPPGADLSTSIDDLIGEMTKGVTPAEKKEEKKTKKEKNMKLIFHDEKTSPEEKMASLPRFAAFARR